MRASIFIDFWNFQLCWNETTGRGVGCDWFVLPRELLKATDKVLEQAGAPVGLTLEQTLVHASVKTPATAGDAKLREWLTNVLDMQPSYDVKIRERRRRPRPVYCAECGETTERCPGCGAVYRSAAEKGVDAAMVTDLLSLAWQDAYDVAILVSGDADYIPAVEYVQDQGRKVINAAWNRHAHELKRKCWGSFSLDRLVPALTRH